MFCFTVCHTVFCAYITFQLTDDVTRKKMEYQKNLEMYKLMRSRFEEYYVKCEYAKVFLNCVSNDMSEIDKWYSGMTFFSWQRRSQIGWSKGKISEGMQKTSFNTQWICFTVGCCNRMRTRLENLLFAKSPTSATSYSSRIYNFMVSRILLQMAFVQCPTGTAEKLYCFFCCLKHYNHFNYNKCKLF